MRSLTTLRHAHANHVTAVTATRRFHRQKLQLAAKTTTGTTATKIQMAACSNLNIHRNHFNHDQSQSQQQKLANYHCRGLSSISIPFGTADDNLVAPVTTSGSRMNMNTTNSGKSTIGSASASASASVGGDLDTDTDTDMSGINSNNDDIDIKTTLDEYANKQLQLLAYIEQLKNDGDNNNGSNNNNNNNNNGDNNSNSNSNSNKIKMKEEEYLDEIWNIANTMDTLVQKQYHSTVQGSPSSSSKTTTTTFDMEYFNTVIEAWKVVLDAYNTSTSTSTNASNGGISISIGNNNSSNSNSTSTSTSSNKNNSNSNSNSKLVGIPQRATRLLEIMETEFKNHRTGRISSIPSATSALSIDTFNNVLEMWSMSNEHNLDAMAETIFRRVEEYTDKIRISEHNKKQQRWRLRWSSMAMAEAATAPLSLSLSSSLSSSSSSLEPNVDTMKIMIRAWCKDRYDGRAIARARANASASANFNRDESMNANVHIDATLNDYTDAVLGRKRKKGSHIFNAAKYLIKMQVMLENGFEEFEPSLEDYLIVFESWGEVT